LVTVTVFVFVFVCVLILILVLRTITRWMTVTVWTAGGEELVVVPWEDEAPDEAELEEDGGAL
jgi:hypothetical protein